MKTYYWENPVGMNPDCGRFMAKDDEEALKKMPKTSLVLYRESDTIDGYPFVTIYEKRES